MPVWKSSYRLVFGASGQPTLEGWAIIDNTTGDDWTNVRLALVSGRPISFISRLTNRDTWRGLKPNWPKSKPSRR